MAVALITGGSRGLGRAVALALADAGWSLVLDARGVAALEEVAAGLPADRVVAIAGDVTDAAHREELVEAAEGRGGLDLLLNNASDLGPSPMPSLASYPGEALRAVYAANVLAPVSLIQLSLPLLRKGAGVIVNVSSDAGAEAYAGWAGYGSSKAALDHASAILALEEPEILVYAFDPGDMRTEMHQRAYPGEDISDRPEPMAVAVPALLRLLRERPASGRYRASELVAAAAGAQEAGAEATAAAGAAVEAADSAAVAP